MEDCEALKVAYQKFTTIRTGTQREEDIQEPAKSDFSRFSNFSDLHSLGTEEGLAALRPHLVPSLAALDDPELLALVRHAIENAKERTRGRGHRYCPDCGLRLSVVAVSARCGFCQGQLIK